MNPMILLSGPPDAGKSTVAKELIAGSAGPTVCAKGGYKTIVDFSIPLWFIDPLRARFPDMAFDYVVIRPAAAICAARAAARSEGAIADYTPYLDFYADFDVAKANLIADDSSGPAAIATLIREGLEAGRFRLAPAL